jgi:hypothetical protein
LKARWARCGPKYQGPEGSGAGWPLLPGFCRVGWEESAADIGATHVPHHYGVERLPVGPDVVKLNLSGLATERAPSWDRPRDHFQDETPRCRSRLTRNGPGLLSNPGPPEPIRNELVCASTKDRSGDIVGTAASYPPGGGSTLTLVRLGSHSTPIRGRGGSPPSTGYRDPTARCVGLKRRISEKMVCSTSKGRPMVEIAARCAARMENAGPGSDS